MSAALVEFVRRWRRLPSYEELVRMHQTDSRADWPAAAC
jgi:hypothetical protein